MGLHSRWCDPELPRRDRLRSRIGPACETVRMDQVALYLQDAHDIREGIEIVRYAESKGFDAVWQADSRLVRDAVVPMAAFAATTDRIKIGSGVIDIWTRNAARLASTAGCRTVVGDTSEPRRTRSVTAARAAMADQHSSTGPSVTDPSSVLGMK